jgi:general secretion pathway protein L
MGQRILALEISGDHVRGALADRTYKSFDLVRVYEQERAADEPDLVAALTRIVAATGPLDITISALPGEQVAKRLLTLPFTDRRRLRQVVPFALEEHLPFAVDDAAVAFAAVGRENGGTLVIAAFARKEILERHLELLARAGIDPKTVTLSTHALAGFLSRVRNGYTGSQLVVEIQESGTSMVLMDQAGMPRAIRTVSQGFDLRTESSKTPAAANAILTAVRQTLLVHGSSDTPAELFLAGPAAASPELRKEFIQALEVPVHDLTELNFASLLGKIAKEPARFAGCLAMLLSEAPAAPIELINFRQGTFAFHGSSGSLHPLRLTGLLAVCAVVLAVLHVTLAIAVGARQLHLLNDEIKMAAAPALGDTDPATAKSMLQAKLTESTKRLRLLGGNLGHGSPLDVLLKLSRDIPPSVPIQANTLLVDQTGLKLEGSADSFAAVDQVKRLLERGGDFTGIEVEHAGAGNDTSKVEFRLSAQFKDTTGSI